MALPLITLNERPNPRAMVLGCRALIDLGLDRENQSAAKARAEGGEQVFWRSFPGLFNRNPQAYRLNVSIWRDAGTLWVTIYGTDNWALWVSYVGTLVPAYWSEIGAFTFSWAIEPALDVHKIVDTEIRRNVPERVVLVGHSLGGAVAHLVSRLVSRSFSQRDPPGIVSRILFEGPLRTFTQPGRTVTDLFEGRTPFHPTERRQERMTQRPGIPVEVLTFGEPRCIGARAEFPPTAHWRIVAALRPESGVIDSGPQPRVDPVTLMPPNVTVAPGPSLLAGIPGVATLAGKAGVGIIPQHYGVPVYLTDDGRSLRDPYGVAGRFVGELGLGVLGLVSPEVISLHLIDRTYLLGSERLVRNNGVIPFELQELPQRPPEPERQLAVEWTQSEQYRNLQSVLYSLRTRAGLRDRDVRDGIASAQSPEEAIRLLSAARTSFEVRRTVEEAIVRNWVSFRSEATTAATQFYQNAIAPLGQFAGMPIVAATRELAGRLLGGPGLRGRTPADDEAEAAAIRQQIGDLETRLRELDIRIGVRALPLPFPPRDLSLAAEEMLQAENGVSEPSALSLPIQSFGDVFHLFGQSVSSRQPAGPGPVVPPASSPTNPFPVLR